MSRSDHFQRSWHRKVPSTPVPRPPPTM